MTAKDHNKLLGILFLIWGGLQIIGFGIAILFMLGIGGAALSGAHSRDAAPIAAIFGFTTVILVFAMIFAIPAIIAGLKMRKEKPGAKTWVLISAILALLSFPLGTALGVYALWFMFGDQGKSFYSGGNGGNAFNQPPPNSWR
ncbi:MAG TPA: hypothetical protein VF571_11155 [Pyrinomonadaceae bacterium]|jgi:hypothetical protein